MKDRAKPIGEDRATAIMLIVGSLFLIPFLVGMGWGAGFGFGDAVYQLGWYETADPLGWLGPIVSMFMYGAVLVPSIIIVIADLLAVRAMVRRERATRYPLWGVGIGVGVFAVFALVSTVLWAVK